jgi:hypothetical protein
MRNVKNELVPQRLLKQCRIRSRFFMPLSGATSYENVSGTLQVAISLRAASDSAPAFSKLFS